jgi:translation elongation factor EF-1alpha
MVKQINLENLQTLLEAELGTKLAKGIMSQVEVIADCLDKKSEENEVKSKSVLEWDWDEIYQDYRKKINLSNAYFLANEYEPRGFEILDTPAHKDNTKYYTAFTETEDVELAKGICKE